MGVKVNYSQGGGGNGLGGLMSAYNAYNQFSGGSGGKDNGTTSPGGSLPLNGSQDLQLPSVGGDWSTNLGVNQPNGNGSSFFGNDPQMDQLNAMYRKQTTMVGDQGPRKGGLGLQGGAMQLIGSVASAAG